MEALGEMIPNENTYCEIDPSVVDEWGIPVLRFHWRAGENEIKMAKDMPQTFRAIVEVAGGTYSTDVTTDGPAPYGLYDGGTAIHESGTVRMGDNPKSSALNKYCQAHDVKNLFVTDAGAFVTSPDKNPTLSILALSWRASEISWSKRSEAISSSRNLTEEPEEHHPCPFRAVISANRSALLPRPGPCCGWFRSQPQKRLTAW
jgi:choline dehydrogenase-like flavoprotein